MILDRIRLMDVLETLKLSVGNKVMEVSFFLKFIIDEKNHAVYLTTTDYHSFILIDFGDVDLSPLNDVPSEFLINFDSFYSLVRASTTNDVIIAQDGDTDDGFVTIETNGSFSFPLYLNISQFPIANFTHQISREWEVDALLNVWSKVAPVVSKDVTKLSYQGVNYDGNWAASDNRRLALVNSDDDYEGDGILVPVVFGDIVERCEGKVSVGVNEMGNMLILTNPESGIMAAMRLIDAKFVQYQRMIEARANFVSIRVSKPMLLGALRRLSCFTDKLFKVGTFTIVKRGASVDLRCEIQNASNQGVEIIEVDEFTFVDDVDEDGDVIGFQYQIDNVAAGIDCVDSKKEVELTMQHDGKLWVDEGNFHYVLSRIST